MITIKLSGLKQAARLGCSEAERARMQVLRIDLEITLAQTAAVTSDRIGDTIDYSRAIECIQKMAEEKSWRLMECMCHDIACELLRISSLAQGVKVQITKHVFPHTDGVSVTLDLARKDLKP